MRGPYLVRVETSPISIGHLLCHLEFLRSHLYRSVIFLSVCVQFGLGPHPYLSIIHRVNSVFGVASISIDHLPCQFEFILSFWGHTYIDRSSSCQFVFSSSWDHTYIDRLFILSVQLVFWGRTYIDQPFSCQFVFSLSFRAAPISIDHLPISLYSVQVRVAPISISHYHVNSV